MTGMTKAQRERQEADLAAAIAEKEEAEAQLAEAQAKLDPDFFEGLDPAEEVGIDVIAPGAFPSVGILPIGAHKRIEVSAFSGAWMKPHSAADAKIIKAWVSACEKDRAYKASKG